MIAVSFAKSVYNLHAANELPACSGILDVFFTFLMRWQGEKDNTSILTVKEYSSL